MEPQLENRHSTVKMSSMDIFFLKKKIKLEAFQSASTPMWPIYISHITFTIYLYAKIFLKQLHKCVVQQLIKKLLLSKVTL